MYLMFDASHMFMYSVFIILLFFSPCGLRLYDVALAYYFSLWGSTR